jgi:two-component system, NtrC family, response regulator
MPPRTQKLPLSAVEVKLLVIVEDHELYLAIRQACPARWSPRRWTRLPGARDARPGDGLDAIVVDAAIVTGDARTAFDRIIAEADTMPVLVIAPPGGSAPAFELIEGGAADVLSRPPDGQELTFRLGRAFDTRDMGAQLATLEEAISERSRRSYDARTLVKQSSAMAQVCQTAERVAGMRSTVLILGESGVGKELVARNIHFNSPRSDAAFIAINCAAMPPHLIESELFGHEKGAFTGAVSRRAGKFELAQIGRAHV